MTREKDLVGVLLMGASPLLAAVDNDAPFKTPTFIEQGFPGLIGSTWAGVLAPAGTPRPIIDRMSSELAKIINSDETRAKLDAMGTFAVGSSPQAFDAFIAEETAKWGNVIKTAGVTVDQ